jgi:hypothetical protein
MKGPVATHQRVTEKNSGVMLNYSWSQRLVRDHGTLYRPNSCDTRVRSFTQHEHHVDTTIITLPKIMVSYMKEWPIPVAERSKARVCCWDSCSNNAGRAWMSVCRKWCQVDAPATGPALVQRNPTACGVSLCALKNPHAIGSCARRKKNI